MFSTRVVPAGAATAQDVLTYLPKVFQALRNVDDLGKTEEEIVIDVLKQVEGVIPRPHFFIVADIVRALIAGLDLGKKEETIEILPSVEATPTKVENGGQTS